MVDFGERLKNLRQQEGLSQQQLANKLGVTKSVISYYELHERHPSPEVLIKLSVIFHTSTDFLLGLEKSGNIADLSGLDEEDVIIVKKLIASLRKKNFK